MSARLWLPIAILLGVFFTVTGAYGADPVAGVQPGDTVIVSKDDVKLMLGEETIATLNEGTLLIVGQVKGDWIGCETTVDGQKWTGWVRSSDVVAQPDSGSSSDPSRADSRADTDREVLTDSIGMKLAPIPAGEFMMGYSGGDRHRVEITKPLYLGVYEVTQAEYELVMGDNPSNFQHGGFRDRGGVLLGLDTSRFPVEGGGWASCEAFCERLSQLPDERAAGRKYRLPTEAEWEYACRAGTDTPYCYGDTLDADSANFKGVHPESGSGPRADRTTTVGSYKPNAWGLYDMHGNVREWCQDWYSKMYYATSATDNPQGPSWGSAKVLRGGYFCGGEDSCRSGCRDESSPTTTYCHDGFRVLCELVGQNETTPTRRQVTALFTVREGDENGPTFEGAEIDLLHRPNSEAEGVALGHATSDAQGLARLTLSVTPEQQSKGEFFVVLKSPDSAEPRTLPGFPRSLKWNLYLPRRLSHNPAGLKTVTNSIGMYLVLIPAGEFQMGFPDSYDETYRSRAEIAKPQHLVRITKPFYLGAAEVTQEQYERVVGKKPSANTGDPQLPVERVSWNDAMEFCRLLGEKEGKEYRLPTEAEWEYACRAGTTTAFYCAGVDLVNYEWIECSETHPVGRKKPNPWGLYDMQGNVGEWCADVFGESYYAESPKDDPIGPTSGYERVHRGGCYVNDSGGIMSALRWMDYESETDDVLGFRVALTP